MNLNARFITMLYRNGVVFFVLGMLLATSHVFAGDNAQLISMTITNGTQVVPRNVYTETWTFLNTGTTTWAPTNSGYTLNLTSLDSLGLMQAFANGGSWFQVSAIIGSNKSVAPGQTASYSINFIAPEAAGSYTDSFQLNTTGGAYFGPVVTLQVNVGNNGNTNVYDRCRAVSFANNYAAYYCPDGYYWTSGSGYSTTNADSFIPAPSNVTGDDCAHFVSYCIGSGPYVRGGGMKIPSRTATYGEPGAGNLIYTMLLGPGYGVEVSSLSQLEPGDVIGWNWEGETNAGSGYIDHVTLYMGNGLVAAHANCHLDVATSYYGTGPVTVPGTGWSWHLIHILDYPTLWTSRSGKNMTFMWTTNWSGYGLYTNKSLTGTWGKVSASPSHTGDTNKLTLTLPSSGAVYYRLEMH